jgi:hypothetical protein
MFLCACSLAMPLVQCLSPSLFLTTFCLCCAVSPLVRACCLARTCSARRNVLAFITLSRTRVFTHPVSTCTPTHAQVVGSRMRFMASQLKRNLRIIGLAGVPHSTLVLHALHGIAFTHLLILRTLTCSTRIPFPHLRHLWPTQPSLAPRVFHFHTYGICGQLNPYLLDTCSTCTLAASVANAKDLGSWLGISSQNLFNFHPNVRPLRLEIDIQGFNISHTASRLAAMQRPTHNAIKTHSPDTPVIVFVPSRQQAQHTAVDLVSQALADGREQGCVASHSLSADHFLFASLPCTRLITSVSPCARVLSAPRALFAPALNTTLNSPSLSARAFDCLSAPPLFFSVCIASRAPQKLDCVQCVLICCIATLTLLSQRP